MNKKITIGRDYSSDIKVNDQYQGVSRNHATISSENGRVIFEDISTNGSYINGVQIHHARKEINNGDVIYLGKQYILSWVDINRHLGTGLSRATVKLNSGNSYPESGYAQQFSPLSSPIPGRSPGENTPSQVDVDRELAKWNWGAFFFSWIWAICNGIYWPLVVLIPYIGWGAAFIINILLGIKGNAWAWKAKPWNSLEEFRNTQKKWSMWALYVFLGSIALSILAGFMAAVMMAGF